MQTRRKKERKKEKVLEENNETHGMKNVWINKEGDIREERNIETKK